ncbi:MAG: SoxR reducing system RseC family protein [Azoarcus sp.]|jgi:sigma-E factor negative regulatory protein RseC|nr:SoxR reducing system RseC family protein [Azoarcus sp.]
MIEARALVLRAGDGKAQLRLLEQQGGCGRCDEPGGCHAPQFVNMFKGSKRVFTVDDALGLQAGERVKIVIDEGTPLRAAWASYGLGTALVLAGAVAGVWFAPAAWADSAAATGGVIGMAAMALILRRRALRSGPTEWRPRLERDTGNEPTGCMKQVA